MSENLVEVPVLLPKLGESVAEAVVLEWLKEPGDFVQRDELFVMIGTDKVDSEMPCEYEGVLHEILVPAGERAAVGSAICSMLVDAAQVKDKAPVVAKNTDTAEDKAEAVRANSYADSKRFLSPMVRKIATEAGLELSDLDKIVGSGENGRVRKQDVLKYLNKSTAPSAAAKGSGVPINEKQNLAVHEGDSVEKLSRMQSLLANHLQLSFLEIPHVTTFVEVDVTDMVRMRDEWKEDFVAQYGTKVTYTHFIQYAAIQALKDFPLLNSWMNVDEIVLKKSINLGFAASLPNGDLIVPNVRDAAQYDFVGWVKAVNNKAAEAKSQKLTADDVMETTFTLSNTGMFGSLAGTPIISRPQVAVVALGEILSAPGVVVEDGEEKLAVRKKMIFSISYDHRVINGAYASQFLVAVKKKLSADGLKNLTGELTTKQVKE
ncbi:MAG: dihydrolipoamide acetyltransferase family protein [Weeksellaceae bacterium]|nr:dihydrolipoamide acetyltransferase family protein [Weeksellaceae bacterium]